VFGWELSDQSSAGCSDIDSFEVSFSWDSEELLFKTQSHDGSAVFNADFFQESLNTLAKDTLACSEQSLIVQGVPEVRNQECWNVKGFVSVSEQNVRLDVPDSISSGLAGLSEASRGEAGSVCFSFQEMRGAEVAISLGVHGAFAEEIV